MSEVDYKVDGVRHIHFTQGVKRWHTLELSAPQSLADHHWAVTMLLKAICPELPHVIAEWAMVHDMDELISGDIPGHFKARMDPRALVAFNKEVISLMPTWWKTVYQYAILEENKTYMLVLKACDMADQARVARRIIGASARSKICADLDIRAGEAIDAVRNAIAKHPIRVHPNWISILIAYRTEA